MATPVPLFQVTQASVLGLECRRVDSFSPAASYFRGLGGLKGRRGELGTESGEETHCGSDDPIRVRVHPDRAESISESNHFADGDDPGEAGTTRPSRRTPTTRFEL
jgi:hypothetical protein